MFTGSLGEAGTAFISIVMMGCVVVASVPAARLDSPDPAQRRAAVLAIIRQQPPDGLQLLTKALTDQNTLVKRAAVRGLRALGAPAVAALTGALSNPDPEVRMTAFLGLNELGALTLDRLAVAIGDKENAAMRQSAAEILAKMTPLSQETRALLEQASKDESAAVREVVSKALYPFPFFRQTESIRDRTDNVITVTRTIPLPADGWKLKFDLQQNGHAAKWFDPGLNDSDWTAVSIGKFWDDFGFKGQTGIGWYRGKFTLPAKPTLNAVELCFEAVDESTWVWINGEYAGQHDIGPDGWTVAFRLDVTPFLKWGQENHITVRVLNTAYAGGIWKPVTIEILKIGK